MATAVAIMTAAAGIIMSTEPIRQIGICTHARIWKTMGFLKTILAVGAGSFLGGAGRYLVSWELKGIKGFPWATLAVNIAGCFLDDCRGFASEFSRKYKFLKID